MKRKIASIILIISILFINSLIFAEEEIRVSVNGTFVEFDVQPFIEESNRTLIPVRFISEKLGAKVTWDADTQSVLIDLNNKHVVLKTGDNKITINGVAQAMDTKAIIKDSRIFVPVRFVAEALDAVVKWENETRTIAIATIKTEEAVVENTPNFGNETDTIKVSSIIEKDQIVMFMAFTPSETSVTDDMSEINFYFSKIEDANLVKLSEIETNDFLENYEFTSNNIMISIINKVDQNFMLYVNSDKKIEFIDQRDAEITYIYSFKLDGNIDEFIESINHFLQENK